MVKINKITLTLVPVTDKMIKNFEKEISEYLMIRKGRGKS